MNSFGYVRRDCSLWVFQSAEWPIDPAFSRNPKPPALAGGVFIQVLAVPDLVTQLFNVSTGGVT